MKEQTDQELMDELAATVRYDKTAGDWRKMPETEPADKADLGGLLRKGDVPGHEFHGNQYESVAGVGDSTDYKEASRVANQLTAEANRTGDPKIHREAMEAHKKAAEIAKQNLSTRAMTMHHSNYVDYHSRYASQESDMRSSAAGYDSGGLRARLGFKPGSQK